MTGDSRFDLTRRRALGVLGASVGGLALGGTSVAAQHRDDSGTNAGGGTGGGARTYRVTVANRTNGQPFTPPAVAAHRPDVGVFSVGEPASRPVREVAENGNLGPLVELIEETDAIRASAVGGSPLVPSADPGDTGLPYSATLEFEADASATHLTFLCMLVATNDGFAGLDTVPLPDPVGASRTYHAGSYDAGTEENSEDFRDMVPPADTLMGVDSSDEGTTSPDPRTVVTDGVVTPHPGIAGTGDLDPEIYGWEDPAALVHVERTG
ncbi:MAG: spondin domain-containing protein [Haloferacaceae archaeon]